MIDVSGFGPGERLVFEPYTREMFEQTYRWMENEKLFSRNRWVRGTIDGSVSAQG